MTNQLSRRTLLAAAGAAAFAACGSSGPKKPDAESKDGTVLVRLFADGNQGVGTQRHAFGLATTDGVFIEEPPASVTATLVGADGKPITALTAQRRGEGLPRPYYAFDTKITTAGTYALQYGGVTASFTVSPTDQLLVPHPGQALPAIESPTITDSRGVTPICTANPICPFHTVTVKEALAAAKPVVLLVGTPAHCKTAVCGPVLTFLIDEQPSFANKASIVHMEPYANDDLTEIAPGLAALSMQYEPALFVTDAKGIITSRLDHVWDLAEQRAALAAIVK